MWDVPLHAHGVASAYGVAKDNLAAASAPVAEFDLSDESIRMLADLLKLPPHDDTAVLLQAIAATLNAKFNPIAVSAALAAKDEVSVTPPSCPAPPIAPPDAQRRMRTLF